MSQRFEGYRSPIRKLTTQAVVSLLSLLMLVCGAVASSTIASAALLGVGQPLPFPRISFNNGEAQAFSYNPVSDLFSLDAKAEVYVNTGMGGTCNVVGDPQCLITPPNDVTLRIMVDETGALIGGVPGDDLSVSGTVTIDGTLYSGVLITGEILGFGFEDTNPAPSTSADKFDFRFQVTGGLLNIAGLFENQDIGLTVSPDFSTFGGSFSIAFGGTDTKGDVFPTPPECVNIKKQVSVETLAELEASGRLFGNDPTWQDADTADTGPGTLQGNATYRLIVENCGSKALSSVNVEDVQPSSLPGNLETILFNVAIGPLAIGEQKVIVSSAVGGPNVQSSLVGSQSIGGFDALDAPQRCMDLEQIPNADPKGKLLNTARVSTPGGGKDEDPAWVMCLPDIDLKKQVSVLSLADLEANGQLFVDDPAIWKDADTFATGPNTELGATYRLVVKNTGAVPLTNVTLDDFIPTSLPGGETILFNVNIGTLAIGEQKVIVTSAVGGPNVQSSTGGPETIAGFGGLDAPQRCLDPGVPMDGVPQGKLLNTARVRTDEGPTDDDPAWVMCQPDIDLKKQVSVVPLAELILNGQLFVDDSSIWFDADTFDTGPLTPLAATYRLVVRNTGAVKLTNVTLKDILPSSLPGIETIVFDKNIGDLAIGEQKVIVSSSVGGANVQSNKTGPATIPGFERLNAPKRCMDDPVEIPGVPDGKLLNTAQVTTEEGPMDTDPAWVMCQPDIEIKKQVSVIPLAELELKGQLFVDDPTIWFDADTPDTGPMSTLGATYRLVVRNTGTVALSNVKLEDVQPSSSLPNFEKILFNVNIGDLAVGEQKVIVSSTVGGANVQSNQSLPQTIDGFDKLDAPQRCLDPAVPIPGVPSNKLLNTSRVSTEQGPKDDDPAWVMCQLECDLEVIKTCLIPKPPSSPLTGKCSGKIQQWTVIWQGTQPITVSGLPNDAPGGNVAVGQEVTFFNPGGGENDVFVNINDGQVNVQSKFHLSCSDDDMNADNDDDVQSQLPGKSQDCGKFAGNGKDNNSDFNNNWIFEGLVDADGLALDCTAAPQLLTETEQCEFSPLPATGGSCSDIKDISALKLVWDGASGTTLTSETGQVISNMQKGQVIVLDAPKDQTGNDVDVFLSGAVNGQSQFHISCSDDAMNGPEDCGMPQGDGKSNNSSFVNSFLLGGMTGENGTFTCAGIPGVSDSVDVIFGFTVKNLNDEPVTVNIVDAQLGISETRTIDANDDVKLITDALAITPDGTGTDPFDPTVFKNTVFVTGTTDSGAVCEAMDMVRIKRNPPPPAPVSCSDIKDITAVSVVWNGQGTVDLVMESGEVFKGVAPGNQITFQEAGTGNDVEMTISGSAFPAENGLSKFHVSCSDEGMNGSDDCGTAQGNGKDDSSSLVNLWKLDGMTGENGSFACNVPNTGVVSPTSGGAGGGNVTGAATLDLGDDKKAKWELTNNGSADVFVTRVEVSWPGEHVKLKKFKLAGDFAKDVNDTSSPTVVPDDKAFESDANKRKLKKGETKKLEIEFDKDFKAHTQSSYTISVEFDNGQVLAFP